MPVGDPPSLTRLTHKCRLLACESFCDEVGSRIYANQSTNADHQPGLLQHFPRPRLSRVLSRVHNSTRQTPPAVVRPAGEQKSLFRGVEGYRATWRTQPSELAYAVAVNQSCYGWSGRRDSNPRPPPWQGGALPLSHFRFRATARLHGLVNKVPRDRIELSTPAFSVPCSTPELPRPGPLILILPARGCQEMAGPRSRDSCSE